MNVDWAIRRLTEYVDFMDDCKDNELGYAKERYASLRFVPIMRCKTMTGNGLVTDGRTPISSSSPQPASR